LNDDVLKHPYDKELKQIALAFAVLLKPMVESIDRYGLKSRFLRKHLVAVDRFYRRIPELTLHSETALKFKERLEKNRDKLFTFLNFDGVPWNNNSLVSRIYGLILVPGAARACDIGLFPSLRRYGIRKIVWSPLEFCC